MEYEYIDTAGNMKRVKADSSEAALKNAPDIASNSGVMSVNPSTSPKSSIVKDKNLGNYSVSEPEDKALNELISGAEKESNKTINEEDIRTKTLKQFQGEINAIDEIYNSLVADEKIAGENREGQGRAIQNRQGTIGSLRGAANATNIVVRNQEAVGAIQAERAAKIGNVMGRVRSSALEEIQNERLAKQQGASDYLKYIELQDERRSGRVTDTVASLISQGYTLDDLSPEEITELTKNLNVSPDALRSKYEELKEDPEVAEAFTLGANDIRFDAEGNVIARGSKTGAGTSSKSTGSTTTPNSGYDDEYIDTLTFDEFKKTPEALALIKQAEEAAQMNFPQERRDRVLKDIYDQEIANLETTTKKKAVPSLTDLTPTMRRELSQAGLSSSDGRTQTFYINLPASIKSEIQRGVAAGIITPEDLTIEQMQSVLDEGSSSKSTTKKEADTEEDPFDYKK